MLNVTLKKVPSQLVSPRGFEINFITNANSKETSDTHITRMRKIDIRQ